MGTFLSDLRSKISKASGQAAPWGDVNPLVVIGLTEAILDLGLNEDQTYQVIRSYGRQLAAQVHPDRQATNISDERQRTILGVFEILDNREHFNRALAEFKTLRAEDRRENRTLSQALSALKSRVGTLESNFSSLEDGKKILAEERQIFERKKVEEKLLVPDLEKKVIDLVEEAKKMGGLLKRSEQSASDWKRQFESAAKYFSDLGSEVSGYKSSVHAFDAKWVAVLSLWPIDAPNPSPFDEVGEVRSEFFEETSPLLKDRETVLSIVELWKRAVTELNSNEKSSTKRLPIGLSVIELNVGRPRVISGHRSVGFGGRIIGSLPFDKLPITRNQLKQQINQNIVFDTIHPFLIPGSILVSIRKDRDARKRASWSLTCPAIYFSTRRMILAVG